MKRRLSPLEITKLGLLLAGATMSVVMLYSARPAGSEGDKTPRLSIAYFLKQAQLVGTGPDGNILYRVNMATAEQNLDDLSVEMRDVYMTYEPAANIPWNLAADEGRIPQSGQLVELSGRVIAISQTAVEPATIIRTTQLAVHPESSIARSKDQVIIEREGEEVNGTGLEADLKTNHIQLLSNVNGKFSP
ncbi:MAG: LPS export ABC transporter periplasmic protein LptC [Gammaproteobacteria bacterium]